MVGIGRAAARQELAQGNIVWFLRQHYTYFSRQRHDAIPSLGLAYDSAQRRRSVLDQVCCHGPVRCHHEIFDHVARAVATDDGKVYNLAIHDDGPGLDAFEVECARDAPRFTQPLCGFVLNANLLLHLARCGDRRRRGSFALEPESDALVGEFGLVVHHGAIYGGVRDRALGGHVEFDNHCEAVLTFVQRREICREPVGKHREDRDASVD